VSNWCVVEAKLPAQKLPAQKLPAQKLPAQKLPAQKLPAQALPAQALPAQGAVEVQGRKDGKRSEKVKGKGHLSSWKFMMKRVLCVWLPNWPLQRIFVERTELRERPIVLYQAGRRGLQVVTCCREAAQRGVFTGMPVAEARGLFQADVSLATGENKQRPPRSATNEQEPYFQRHDPQADLSSLEKLATYCLCFSPIVGWDETDLPDTLLLDVTGCAHLFQNEQCLAARIVAELRQLGYRARVASAGTVGAAWALAHYHPPQLESKDLSQNHVEACDVHQDLCHKRDFRTDSKSEIPGLVNNPELKSEILFDLPIEALRLDEQTVRTLRELDIGQIGQLETLPRASLPSRLGTQVIRRLDQAMGRAAELIVPVRPSEVIAASKSFEHPLIQRAALETVLQQLAEQILVSLARRGAGVQRLEVRLVALHSGNAGGRDALCCSVGFISPCNEAEHLVRMILSRLSRLPVPGEIIEVHVRVTCSSLLETRQGSLLGDEQDDKARRQFGLLLERMSSRLGEQCVLRAQLRPDAQPEYACCWETAVGSEVDAVKSEVGGPTSEVGAQRMATARPLAIKPRPVLVAVLTALTEGPPIRFRWEGREYVVSRSWGPERIATGWWRKNPIYRDYYRIETDQGQQLWLFCRNHDRTWFLQGEFV